MDGTAIYQGVCAIFIAACHGIDLNIGQMITIVLTATLASIGTAVAPGAGMVMLAMVLESVGLPVAGIGLVMGVDCIFDMGRTTINITGDTACAVIVSRMEERKAALGQQRLPFRSKEDPLRREPKRVLYQVTFWKTTAVRQGM